VSCAAYERYIEAAKTGKAIFYSSQNSEFYTCSEFLALYENNPELFNASSWQYGDPMQTLENLEDRSLAAAMALEKFKRFLGEKGVVRAVGN
jgi:hypothetical protein